MLCLRAAPLSPWRGSTRGLHSPYITACEAALPYTCSVKEGDTPLCGVVQQPERLVLRRALPKQHRPWGGGAAGGSVTPNWHMWAHAGGAAARPPKQIDETVRSVGPKERVPSAAGTLSGRRWKALPTWYAAPGPGQRCCRPAPIICAC